MVESAGDYENMMACRNPWVRFQGGAEPAMYAGDKKVRHAVTPFPCGNCLPCRINKSKEWSTRILLEQKVHTHSCFATLTYEDEKMTRDDDFTAQVDPRDLTLFLKKVRNKYGEIRYFAVGEYGEKLKRPHFHAMLFGVAWNEHNQSNLEKLWGNGWVSLGEVNETTARYIAGYCLKKLTTEGDDRLYGKKPEIMRVSRGTKSNNKGGLGKTFVENLGETINENPGVEKRIIRQIRSGGRLLPLGRYLTRKLADKIGIEESVWTEELEKYRTEIFTENHGRPLVTYKQAIIDTGKGRADSIEKRLKIYQSKRNYEK